MKSGKIGLLSALIASSCCVLPLLLILAGLGSVGFAAQLAQYDWLFATIGVSLLSLSYWHYFRERKACATKACQMRGKKFTQISLGFSTVVIVGVVSIIVLSHIGISSTNASVDSTLPTQQNEGIERATLKIEGMTCISCAWGVEAKIKKMTGVVSANVEFSKGLAEVQYRSQETAPEEFVKTVEEIGYRASLIPAEKQSLKSLQLEPLKQE